MLKPVPRPRTTHELKTWPEFFKQTRSGRKKFELRRNDRDFKVGDELLLKEWDPELELGEEGYTCRELLVRVDYILTSHLTAGFGKQNPLPHDYVILSVSLV